MRQLGGKNNKMRQKLKILPNFGMKKCYHDTERLFHKCLIDTVSKQLKYNDKNLIEKVIRALSLLEMLVEAKCPMVFKGGTSLMLILNDTANRLSIDIDVNTASYENGF